MELSKSYYDGLKPGTNLDNQDLIYLDIRKSPFDLYGFYDPINQSSFKRMPDQVAMQCNEPVHELYLHTAGGRVRFCTDSPYLSLYVHVPQINMMSHMPLAGTSGFSVYEDFNGRSVFINRFMPDFNTTTQFEMRINFEVTKLRYFTIYFPLYNKVDSVYVGLSQTALLGPGKTYRHTRPVVYYGSSITQGGCASRPGNSYQGIISRMCDTNYLNLGFSGAAKGEQAIAEYISGIDMSVFVLDYDYNAPNFEYLANTHEKFFETVRKKNPKLPVVFVSKPDFSDYSIDKIRRRDIIYKTYMNALQKDDGHVYYIDGRSLFQDDYRDCCTVDGVHPNDIGFLRMAQSIGRMVKELI